MKNGYVRYYRKLDSAQQSDRIGTLPLTVRVKGAFDGKRGLEIDRKDYDAIQTLINRPNSVMSNCRIVIVF